MRETMQRPGSTSDRHADPRYGGHAGADTSHVDDGTDSYDEWHAVCTPTSTCLSARQRESTTRLLASMPPPSRRRAAAPFRSGQRSRGLGVASGRAISIALRQKSDARWSLMVAASRIMKCWVRNGITLLFKRMANFEHHVFGSIASHLSPKLFHVDLRG